MALLVPNVGEVVMLEALLNKTAPEDLVLRLYSNDKTPADGDVAGDYTEMTGFGYVAKTLVGSGWTVTPGNPSYGLYAKQTYTFSGAAGNCYGYYLTQLTSGILMWAERFPGSPYNVQQSGDKIEVTPRLEGQTAP